MSSALAWIVLLLVGALVVWVFVRLRAVAAIAAGYKAKVLCSAIFVTGRDIDPRHAPEVSGDSYWFLRAIHARLDRANRVVTTSLAGMNTRRAIYRPGLGATLQASGRDRERIALPGTLDTESIALHADDARRRDPGDAAQRPAAGAWVEEPCSTALQRVVERAFTEPNPRRLRRTRAILVVHHGRVVAERYAPGFGPETPLPGWSMAKSVLAALVGILAAEGRLPLDERELLPQWRQPDPRAAISVEDLLRMRSGLAFSEVYTSRPSDVVKMLFTEADAAAYAASRPLTSPPGTAWSYSSGSTNILSAVIRRIIGDRGYFEWPRRVLFDRIGMRSAVVEPDASGTFIFSSFMFATARDWARYGQLWLDDGRWNGLRILPEGWVRFCTTPTDQSPGGNYGGHWWLELNPEVGGGTAAARQIARDACFAIGHEGQTLTVIPSLNLVVVRLGLSIHIDAWNHAAFIAELQDVLEGRR